MITGRATLPTKPLRASPNANPRFDPRVRPVANAPLLVIGSCAALNARLKPLATLTNRLPVRWGLNLRPRRPSGDSAKVAGNFEEVRHTSSARMISASAGIGVTVSVPTALMGQS